MNTKFCKYLLLSLPLALMALVSSCKDSDSESDEPKVGALPEIEVPARYEIVLTDPHEVTLGIRSGKVEASDVISLQPEGSGTLTKCNIASYTDKTLTFDLPSTVVNGTYTVYYRRASESRNCGNMTIAFVKKTFEPKEGTTIYGTVSTPEGQPVKDVLVSDGTIFTSTNADGQYELASDKALPYVFMVVPSGYEPPLHGVFPEFFHALNMPGDKTAPELFDFTLTPVDQSKFNLLIFGDMHLANRNGDIAAYTKFTKDVNEYLAAHPGEKTYAVTLGDMTWDIYWDKFTLANYVEKVNALFDNLMIYHTIGNHDNNYATTNNFDAKKPFRNVVGPNYYSYNIGNYHFISLDDIDCSTYDGTTSRNYQERMTVDQLDWLRNDLKYVDKSTPLIISLHAPVYAISTATQFKEKAAMKSLLSVLDGYNVDFISGHTHKSFNLTPEHTVVSGKNIREHNIAAVCGDWWWSEKLTPGVHLAHDGTPAGYAIWNFNGNDVKWIYKATGKDTDVQFRSYDLNQVKFNFEEDRVSHLTGSARTTYQRYVDQYPGKQNDYVLLNIWNYNPSWTITVTTEDGQSLTPTAVMAYDPLHIAAMDVKRFRDATSSNPNFITSNHSHFFRVQCKDSEVDLKITVRDEFGNEWTENMVRPKPFDKSDAGLKAYK